MQYHERMLKLMQMVRNGTISMDVFAIQAFDETSHSVHINGLDMLTRRARSLLDSAEDEGIRIAGLKPGRKEGFMEPFWVDGHWKHIPKIGER